MSTHFTCPFFYQIFHLCDLIFYIFHILVLRWIASRNSFPFLGGFLTCDMISLLWRNFSTYNIHVCWFLMLFLVQLCFCLRNPAFFSFFPYFLSPHSLTCAASNLKILFLFHDIIYALVYLLILSAELFVNKKWKTSRRERMTMRKNKKQDILCPATNLIWWM